MSIKIIKPPLINTLISNKHKNSSSSHTELLIVGKKKQYDYRSLLQFDISGLPENITILSSTLHLYLVKNTLSFTNELELLQIISKWQSNNVCWHNQPFTACTPIDSITLKKESYCFVTFDITSLLQGWYSNHEPNLGVLLMSKPSIPNNTVYFASRGFHNAACWPYIEVTFMEQTPPQTACCKKFERSEHVIATSSQQWTKALDLLMFNYAYFALNNGTAPISVTLEISPNNKKWLPQSSTKIVAPGELICLAPDYGAKWSRLQYQTTEPQHIAKATIYIQGRS